MPNGQIELEEFKWLFRFEGVDIRKGSCKNIIL